MITDNQRRILAESIAEKAEDKAYNIINNGDAFITSENFYDSAYTDVIEDFHESEGIDLEDTEYEALRELVDFVEIDERLLAENPNDEMSDYENWRHQ